MDFKETLVGVALLKDVNLHGKVAKTRHLVSQGERTMKVGVGAHPKMAEGNLLKAGPGLHGPALAESVESKPQVLTAGCQQRGHRLVKHPTTELLLGVGHKFYGIVSVLDAVEADREVRALRVLLGKGSYPQGLEGWLDAAGATDESKPGQGIRHDMAGVEIELGVDGGVDVLLTQRQHFPPGLPVGLGAGHGHVPVAVA